MTKYAPRCEVCALLASPRIRAILRAKDAEPRDRHLHPRKPTRSTGDACPKCGAPSEAA
jgi:hypothetical protein